MQNPASAFLNQQPHFQYALAVFFFSPKDLPKTSKSEHYTTSNVETLKNFKYKTHGAGLLEESRHGSDKERRTP